MQNSTSLQGQQLLHGYRLVKFYSISISFEVGTSTGTGTRTLNTYTAFWGYLMAKIGLNNVKMDNLLRGHCLSLALDQAICTKSCVLTPI